jgi:hypothetical protein
MLVTQFDCRDSDIFLTLGAVETQELETAFVTVYLALASTFELN